MGRGERSAGAGGRIAAPPGAPRALDEGILALQRARLLNAAIGLLAEHRYDVVSVAMISSRAGVSRRTYYEVFDNREECLVAILRDAEARAQRALLEAGAAHGPWQERLRDGLWGILRLLDAEPALARVCLVESQRAAGEVSVERRRILARFAAAIDEGARQGGGRAVAVSALTAEALVGAVVAVLAARLGDCQGAANGRAPELCKLLGELMAMIVLPYLGAGAARRELQRPLPELPEAEPQILEDWNRDRDSLAGRPMRLTYRTARALQAVAVLGEDGASPSNRQIAEHAGVQDQGQISKLLSRLARYGLLENAVKDGASRGEANSWRLTVAGRQLVHDIGALDVNGGIAANRSGSGQAKRNAA